MSAYFSHVLLRSVSHIGWRFFYALYAGWMYLLCKVLPSSSALALCKLAEDRQTLERRKGVEM